MKHCPRCGRDLPLDNYSKCSSAKDGKQPWCKACNKEVNSLANPRHNPNNNPKNNARNQGIQWHPEYADVLLWAFQENKCWTCGVIETKRKLHRDHNHVTGWLRGLLCDRCNHLLPTEYCDKSIKEAKAYLAGTGMKQILVDIYIDYLKNPPYFQLLEREGIKLSKKSQKNYGDFLKEGTLF